MGRMPQEASTTPIPELPHGRTMFLLLLELKGTAIAILPLPPDATPMPTNTNMLDLGHICGAQSSQFHHQGRRR
jgi:hypothetical protein